MFYKANLQLSVAGHIRALAGATGHSPLRPEEHVCPCLVSVEKLDLECGGLPPLFLAGACHGGDSAHLARQASLNKSGNKLPHSKKQPFRNRHYLKTNGLLYEEVYSAG
jgi:hypothetical protein